MENKAGYLLAIVHWFQVANLGCESMSLKEEKEGRKRERLS